MEELWLHFCNTRPTLSSCQTFLYWLSWSLIPTEVSRDLHFCLLRFLSTKPERCHKIRNKIGYSFTLFCSLDSRAGTSCMKIIFITKYVSPLSHQRMILDIIKFYKKKLHRVHKFFDALRCPSAHDFSNHNVLHQLGPKFQCMQEVKWRTGTGEITDEVSSLDVTWNIPTNW